MNHSSQKIDISQEFSGIFPVWKRLGETLAVLIERFRQEHDLPVDVKITYAGRLDPAAEGVVLLLVGAVRLEKEHYLTLDKTYLLTILFDVQTDTADLFGLPLVVKNFEKIEHLEAVLKEFTGPIVLPYPAYSSKPVDGKPLFMHARAGKEVSIPSNRVVIKSIELLKQEKIFAEAILARVKQLTTTVVGDFRQEKITNAWEKLLQENKEIFQIATLRVEASSGTYMRSLAEAIGKKLDTPACAFAITREKVGNFTVSTPE